MRIVNFSLHLYILCFIVLTLCFEMKPSNPHLFDMVNMVKFYSWRLSFCSLAYHLTQKAANLLFICTHYLRYAGSLMIWDGISIPNELSVFYHCALAREEKTCIYKWKPIIFWCTCTIFSLCLNPFGNNNSLFFYSFLYAIEMGKN